jgi:alkanesulfonate monooxygenase SsuD/methylene tetrahydromethanopterin reductase-like flavin-dependent oxidoreductase (luciferase family)
MARRGYPDAADRIQELFLAGRRDEAVAAVPDEYVDEGALIGSRERIAKRFVPWTESGITGLTIHTDQDDAVELMAELAGAGHADEGARRE